MPYDATRDGPSPGQYQSATGQSFLQYAGSTIARVRVTEDPSRSVVRFGDFEADLYSRELRKRGVKIALQVQPLQVLEALLRHPGQLVTRDALRQELWDADTFVDFETGLNAAVRRLREALGDAADVPRFVETLPRRGYRFIAPVQSVREAIPPSSHPGAAPPLQGQAPASRSQEPRRGTRQDQTPNRSDFVLARTEDTGRGSAGRSHSGWRHTRRLKWSALAVALTICVSLLVHVSRPRASPGVMRTTPWPAFPARNGIRVFHLMPIR